jgi:hypothetical protein
MLLTIHLNYLIAEKLMLKGQMMVNLFEVYGNLKSLADSTMIGIWAVLVSCSLKVINE